MLFSFFHSFAVIGGTLNMKKGYSSLKIAFLASFEVIFGHFRSFQVILAFNTPRKRFVASGSRKKRVLRVFLEFIYTVFTVFTVFTVYTL